MEGAGDSSRDSLIHHSITGKFAVRKDGWKLILCAGSGSFTPAGLGAAPNDAAAASMGLSPYQLYDLNADPGERYNLYPRRMDKCRELLAILEDAIARGRSTPGADQKNDIEVIIDPEIDDTPVFDDATSL